MLTLPTCWQHVANLLLTCYQYSYLRWCTSLPRLAVSRQPHNQHKLISPTQQHLPRLHHPPTHARWRCPYPSVSMLPIFQPTPPSCAAYTHITSTIVTIASYVHVSIFALSHTSHAPATLQLRLSVSSTATYSMVLSASIFASGCILLILLFVLLSFSLVLFISSYSFLLSNSLPRRKGKSWEWYEQHKGDKHENKRTCLGIRREIEKDSEPKDK